MFDLRTVVLRDLVGWRCISLVNCVLVVNLVLLDIQYVLDRVIIF